MNLKVIFIQYKNENPQDAPWAMECATEYSHDENPDYLLNALEGYHKDKTIAAAQIVNIEVDADEILKLLHPDNQIKGKIKEG